MKKLLLLLVSFFLLWTTSRLAINLKLNFFAGELDIELIKELKTFYIDSCKGDLTVIGDDEEEFTATCKCLFDSIMDVGFTEEELFGIDGIYEIYRAKAKGTHDSLFTENEYKIVYIEMDSIGSCL